MNLTPKDDFTPKKSNIRSISSITSFQPALQASKSAIIEVQEENVMMQKTYSKSEIDLKLSNLETKIDSQFEQLNTKLDYSVQHILSETKNLMLEQQIKEKNEREHERKTTNRWLIGLTVGSLLTLAGIIVSIISILAQGK